MADHVSCRRKSTVSRKASGAEAQPLKDGTNKRGSKASAAQGRRRPPPKLKPSNTDSTDEKDSDAIQSDVSIPQRPERASRPGPRIMEEKIGWSDSSDI